LKLRSFQVFDSDPGTPHTVETYWPAAPLLLVAVSTIQ
jgi:hypothetical protein